MISYHTALASVKCATIQDIIATIQDRTRKPTVFVLHNRLQEASERFLVSSKGSLTSTGVFDHQPRSRTSTRVFDQQPRFLDSLYNLNLTPFSLTLINHSWFPLLIPDIYKVALSSFLAPIPLPTPFTG